MRNIVPEGLLLKHTKGGGGAQALRSHLPFYIIHEGPHESKAFKRDKITTYEYDKDHFVLKGVAIATDGLGN